MGKCIGKDIDLNLDSLLWVEAFSGPLYTVLRLCNEDEDMKAIATYQACLVNEF